MGSVPESDCAASLDLKTGSAKSGSRFCALSAQILAAERITERRYHVSPKKKCAVARCAYFCQEWQPPSIPLHFRIRLKRENNAQLLRVLKAVCKIISINALSLPREVELVAFSALHTVTLINPSHCRRLWGVQQARMNQLQLQDVPLDSQHHRCRRHKPKVDRHALRAKCGIRLEIRRAVNIKIEVAWRRMLIMRAKRVSKK